MILIRIITLLLVCGAAWGNACTSTGTGNWNDASKWSSCGSTFPGNGDTYTINSGHTITVPVGVSVTVGTSPAGCTGGVSCTIVGTNNGPLVINGTLVWRGSITQGDAPVTLGAGAILEFDASQASTPLSQTYAWINTAFSRGSRMITANGTSGSHVIIRSNAGGGNGYLSARAGYSDSLWTNLAYTDFTRIGDASTPSIQYNASTNTTINILSNVTFDANSGMVIFMNGMPLAGGFDFEDVIFGQNASSSQTPLQLTSTAGTVTGTRKCYRCVFTRRPAIAAACSNLDVQDSYFNMGYSVSCSVQWKTWSDNFIRTGTVAGGDSYNTAGSMSEVFYLYDIGDGSTNFDTGTATSGASTTLTDTAKSWTSGQWANFPLKITSGTGAGQYRLIASNSATVLTVSGAWSTPPDATSVYAINILFDSGTSTGGNTSVTLNDSGKSWGASSIGFSSTIGGVFMVETTGGTGAGQRRLIKANTSTQLTVAYQWDTIPDATTTYKILQDIYNNHGLGWSPGITSGSATLDSLIFQNAGTDTQGDNLHLFDTATALTVTRNITLPNAMGDNSGTPFTMNGSTCLPPNGDVGPFVFNNNTWAMGSQSLALSECGSNPTGTITSLRSNIAWNDPTRTSHTTAGSCNSNGYCSHGGTAGPFVVNDTDHTTCSGNNIDVISAGMADYNGVSGMLSSGCAAAGSHYNYQATTTGGQPGAHDVNASPAFVDSTVSFWKWAVSQGSSSVSIGGQIADGLSYLKATPTLTRTSLVPYIQNGFAPTNVAYHNTGYNGGDIGAVPISEPQPATSRGGQTIVGGQMIIK